MPTPVNYVNGVVVLPGFQILTIRYDLIQGPVFIDDYKVTFQCLVNNDENGLQCLTKEVKYILGIDLNCLPFSNKIRLLKFGTFLGPNAKSNITLYFLKIINKITFEVEKDYEVRTLSSKKAFNETLYPLTNGYYNNSSKCPEYTNIAECVLRKIYSYGGIVECIEKSTYMEVLLCHY